MVTRKPLPHTLLQGMVFATALPSTIQKGLGVRAEGWPTPPPKKKKTINNIIASVPATDVELLKL